MIDYRSTSATPEDYKGPLTAESIVKFVYRKTDPILYLNTREEIDGFINSWDNAALAFFDDRPAVQREWSSGTSSDVQLTILRVEGIQGMLEEGGAQSYRIWSCNFFEDCLRVWSAEEAVHCIVQEVGHEPIENNERQLEGLVSVVSCFFVSSHGGVLSREVLANITLRYSNWNDLFRSKQTKKDRRTYYYNTQESSEVQR